MYMFCIKNLKQMMKLLMNLNTIHKAVLELQMFDIDRDTHWYSS